MFLVKGQITAELGLSALALGALTALARPIATALTTRARLPRETFRQHCFRMGE